MKKIKTDRENSLSVFLYLFSVLVADVVTLILVVIEGHKLLECVTEVSVIGSVSYLTVNRVEEHVTTQTLCAV